MYVGCGCIYWGQRTTSNVSSLFLSCFHTRSLLSLVLDDDTPGSEDWGLVHFRSLSHQSGSLRDSLWAHCRVLGDLYPEFPTEQRVFSIEELLPEWLLQQSRKAPCCGKSVCKDILKYLSICLILSVWFYFPVQTLRALFVVVGEPWGFSGPSWPSA